jgi:hypothetical protein
MVVPMLMTNCHVSEQPKKGPVTAHATTVIIAIMNAEGLPTPCDVLLAMA